MRLSELAARIPGAKLVGGDASVSGISHHSALVRPGWLFAALPGTKAHGIRYLEEAISRGAVAVLSDVQPGKPLPALVCSEARKAAALAALEIAGNPQLKLKLVGITGTNGKSTVVRLVASCLEKEGFTVGNFGTLGYRLPGLSVGAERTTPESTDLARMLGQLVAVGGDVAVMEVSSHALAMDRVWGLYFHVAVFTNLSRDHLDFHGSMENYFQAKKKLMVDRLAAGGHRVLPVDDPWARRILADPFTGDITYGIDGGAVAATNLELGLSGSSFDLLLPGSMIRVENQLVGRFNVLNCAAAAAAAWAAGASPEAIEAALCEAEPAPGRLERVDVGLPAPVFVDYAHTPDALRRVLEALREVSHRKIAVVFGAGGDRDKGKRFPMGAVVGELADLAIVTSDNPRSEPPEAIAEAVAQGVKAMGMDPVVVLDRREAIRKALEVAGDGWVVVVAGKGHENYQEIAGKRIPFSDKEVLLELAGRKGQA